MEIKIYSVNERVQIAIDSGGYSPYFWNPRGHLHPRQHGPLCVRNHLSSSVLKVAWNLVWIHKAECEVLRQNPDVLRPKLRFVRIPRSHCAGLDVLFPGPEVFL